jgi:hypothetical protein
MDLETILYVIAGIAGLVGCYWLFVILFAPRYFRVWAASYVDYRRDFRRRIENFAQECHDLKSRLEPFRGIGSSYATIYKSADGCHEDAYQTGLWANRQLYHWKAMEIPGNLHERGYLALGKVTFSLLVDYIRLQWINARLIIAGRKLEKGQGKLKELLAILAKLQGDCDRILTEQIPLLESTIQEERSKGIGVNDWVAELERLRKKINSIQAKLKTNLDIEPKEIVRLVGRFDEVNRCAKELEKKLDSSRKDREELDQKIQEGKVFFAEKRGSIQRGHLFYFKPIISLAPNFEKETMGLRSRKKFSEANEVLKRSLDIIELAALMSETLTILTYLATSQSKPVPKEVKRRIRRFEEITGIQVTSTLGTFPERLQEILDNAHNSDWVTSLLEEVKKLHLDVIGLEKEYQDKIGLGKSSATQAWENLGRQWKHLQNIATLERDPLTAEWRELSNRQRGIDSWSDLSKLDDFTRDANALAEKMRKIREGFGSRRGKVASLLADPRYSTDNLELMVREWSCLGSYAEQIGSKKREAADKLSKIKKLETCARVDDSLHSVEQLAEKIEQIYERMEKDNQTFNSYQEGFLLLIGPAKQSIWQDETGVIKGQIEKIEKDLRNAKKRPDLKEATLKQLLHSASQDLKAVRKSLSKADEKQRQRS